MNGSVRCGTCIYGRYCSATKKNEIMPFAEHGWTQRWSYTVKPVRQRRRSYCLYVESKKKNTNELIYKTDSDLENICMVTGGRVGRRES